VVAGGLRELAEEAGIRLGGTGDLHDAGEMVFAGRWLTPPLGPVRFDNRFFLIEWPADRGAQPRVEPGELEFGEWIAPRVALARWERGELLAAPPVLHFLRVLSEMPPEAALQRLLVPSEANLGPFRIIEFRPGFLVFPLATPTLPPATHTNAILAGFADAVLIDPGSPYEDENRRLVEALRAAGERWDRRVTRILLTHHHPDHVGGVEAMRREFDVPVAAHPATAERLAERGIQVDEVLRDGDEIRLSSMVLRVVHTPGHARGHLVFHDSERRVLLAGDLVSALSTIIIDPPEGNLEDYLDSLARVAELDATLLIPAHGSAMLRPPVRLREAIAHRHGREARIVAALDRGLRTVEELLDAAYDDTPAQVRPLAARQLAAHLESLRRRDRAKAPS
jgi:ribonuclease/clavin/mitogillin